MKHPMSDLEMRKELLIMKAEMQRMELGMQMAEVRQQFAWVRTARAFGGWLTGQNLNRLGPIGQVGGQFLKDAISQYPYLGVAASTLMLRFREPIIRNTAKAGAAAMVLAFAVFWFNQKYPGRKKRP